MEQLGHDLTEVFARRQAGLGSLAGMRERVLAQALNQPRRPGAGRQLAVSVAAILLVALAVGSLLVVRGGLNPHPASTSAPTTARTGVPSPVATSTPAAAPLTQKLQVAAGTPVILYTDPADSTQTDGVTWDGQSRGVVQTGSAARAAGFVAGGPHAANQGAFETQARETALWADDRQHYCVMAHASVQPPAQGEPTTLQFGRPLRSVVQVGTVHQQSVVRVAACSVATDRAVVVQSAGQGVTDQQYWVVQLSTGRILRTQSFQVDGIHGTNVVPSRDAQYIAVVETTCCQQPSTPPLTTIYGSTGGQLAQLTGYVWALSWDGSLAVASRDNAVEVVRWQDGSVIWRGPSGDGYSSSFAEPLGERIAVVLLHAGDPQHGDLWVVGPDGRAQKLVSDPRA